MMNRKSKITGTHTTYGSDLSKIVIRVIENIELVNKIVLGIIKTGLNGSGQRIKSTALPSGALKLFVISANTAQEIYIYGDGGFIDDILCVLENNKNLRNVRNKQG